MIPYHSSMANTKQNRKQARSGPRTERNRRTVRLSDSLSSLTRGIMARQGFAQSDVVTHWRSIVGNTLARYCLPERLAFPRGERRGGTLHIVADSAFALELQHLEPEVIARINSYYGFEAVSHIRITQAPVASRRTGPRSRRAIPPLPPEDTSAIAKAAGEARDDALRKSLDALGRAVYAATGKE